MSCQLCSLQNLSRSQQIHISSAACIAAHAKIVITYPWPLGALRLCLKEQRGSLSSTRATGITVDA